MARQRPKLGDVLEIAIGNRTAYVQYIGEHPEYGGTIWVVPQSYCTPPPEFPPAMGDDGYYAFYPARPAVSRGFAKVVGSIPLEDRATPLDLRRAGARGADGSVLTWIVSRGDREIVRQVLTEEEKRLPIAAIWNHEMLVQRISEAWRPETAF